MSAALDLDDRAAVRAWLTDISGRVDDAIGVAEDQTLPIGKRRLGRAEARRLLAEAKGALLSQLAYARAGLPEAVPV